MNERPKIFASSTLVAPNCAMLRDYLCDTPCHAILLQGGERSSRNGARTLGFTQAQLCDTPCCDISRDNCAIPYKNKHNVVLRCYRYKYRAISKVLLLGLEQHMNGEKCMDDTGQGVSALATLADFVAIHTKNISCDCEGLLLTFKLMLVMHVAIMSKSGSGISSRSIQRVSKRQGSPLGRSLVFCVLCNSNGAGNMLKSV